MSRSHLSTVYFVYTCSLVDWSTQLVNNLIVCHVFEMAVLIPLVNSLFCIHEFWSCLSRPPVSSLTSAPSVLHDLLDPTCQQFNMHTRDLKLLLDPTCQQFNSCAKCFDCFSPSHLSTVQHMYQVLLSCFLDQLVTSLTWCPSLLEFLFSIIFWRGDFT